MSLHQGEGEQPQQPIQEPLPLQPPANPEHFPPEPSVVFQQPVPRFPFSTNFGQIRNSRAASVDSVAEEIRGITLQTPKTPPRQFPQRQASPNLNDPDIQMAVRAFEAMGVTNRKPKIKVREPETYDRKKRGLRADQFIEDCKLYFLVKSDEFKDGRMKIVFAISYLTDTAKTWASPVLRDILGKQKKREARKWEVFEEEFVKAFGDPDKEAAAIRELEALIAKGQKGPATQYASDFRRITMEIDWDESTFIHCYRRGLKDEVKDALVYHPIPTSLDILINLSIRLDERIWERKQERSNEHSHRPPPRPQPRPSTNPFLNNVSPQQPPQPAPQVFRANPNQQAPNAFNHTQPVPIHIDANKRGPPSAEEKARRRAEGRCYYCGLAGHRASDHGLPPRPRQGVVDTTIAATTVPSPVNPLSNPDHSVSPRFQSNNPFSPLAQPGFLPST